MKRIRNILCTLRMLAAVIFLAGSVAANAQFTPMTPPTETDLHASYCSEVIKNSDIPYYEKALALLVQQSPAAPNPARDGLVESMQNYLDASKAALRKLAMYLAPRVFNNNLDPSALMGAQVAADDDIRRIESASSMCSSECIDSPRASACALECVARKVPDSAVIRNKFQACRDLTWLPL